LDLLVIIGYISSVLIGISLGLIGGGGSILTVPVLVYLIGIDPVTATAYSLFVVGASSAVGSVNYFKKGLVNLKTASIFGLPAILSVYSTRKFLVPLIPQELFTMNSFIFTKEMGVMVLFAVLMIAASISMIRGRKETNTEETEQKFNYTLILLEGILVGVLTGLVGAGGGFLIIPALVVLSKLPMKQAIGTSLLIIAAKSLIGFLGDISNREIDWTFLLIFTSISIVGIFIGSALSNRISGAKLKPAFGWFVLLMGIFILTKSLIN